VLKTIVFNNNSTSFFIFKVSFALKVSIEVNFSCLCVSFLSFTGTVYTMSIKITLMKIMFKKTPNTKKK